MEASRSVVLARDRADALVASPPVTWALEELRNALAARGVQGDVVERVADAATGSQCILVASRTATAEVLQRTGVVLPNTPESFALVPWQLADRTVLLVCGTDVRGLVYGVLELADRVSHAADALQALRINRPIVEQPANPVRGVARLFVSDVEDKPWFYDEEFWQRYLTMLVSQRFNRFHLAFGIGYDFLRDVRDAYFLFPYPFLVSVPGYDVRVAGLPDEERERNLATLRFVAEAAKARGLHFQLGLWTHGYEWIDSPRANYTIEGLTPENHAAYCRDVLRTLLQACPAIDGLTIRVHGESGVPEGSHDFWRTVFDGIVECGRRVAIDLHPKGVDRAMIDVALATGMPVTISPKYTAEHMGLPAHQAAIRPLERATRPAEGDGLVRTLMQRSAGDLRYTRYGYADFLAEDRPYGVFFRIWPGTQRLLLWGDPALAAGYGRSGGFCGCLGVELCEPLSFKGRRGSGLPAGRTAYAEASLRPESGDFEKYLYTYRLFGRLLYDPDTDPDAWRRYLRTEFGEAADAAEAALAHASRILPLVTSAHHPSAANNRYWPEMYTNMPIVDEHRPHPYRDTPEPRRFGAVSPLDPALFSRVDDFADELVAGERSGRYSPLDVARWLDDLADAADRHLAAAERLIGDRNGPAFRRLTVDVAIQNALGRFFAEKLRAGVAYALYERTGRLERLREALDAYGRARSAWVEVATHARVYCEDVTIGGEPWLRGHWSDRLAAIDADLGDMGAEWQKATAGEGRILTSPLAVDDDRVRRLASNEPTTLTACSHVPPTAFVRGQPLAIAISVNTPDSDESLAVRLHYRHVNQAEDYQIVAMEATGVVFQATIPEAYTNSAYPLMYFFELRAADGRAWLYPGLTKDLANQPYFVVRPVR